jgi:hypothetical protein
MNAKTAKRLRRAARDATIGKPADGYAVGKVSAVESVKMLDTGVERRAVVKHQHFIVHPQTTRGAYRSLKTLKGTE